MLKLAALNQKKRGKKGKEKSYLGYGLIKATVN